MDLTNKIVFVGTGGGGSMVNLQVLSTGGMWWNIGGTDFYVDPGPAAVWHLRNSVPIPLDPALLEAIFISHAHADHIGDVNTLIEAHYWSTLVENGTLVIGKGQVVKPHEMPEGTLALLIPQEGVDTSRNNVLFTFHRKLLKTLTFLKPESRYPIGTISLTTTKALLEKPWYKDVEEYGFWIEHEKVSVGYVPETYYQKNLFKGFTPRILILNAMVMQKEHEGWQSVIATARAIQPKRVILRHFSVYAVKLGREILAQELEKQTGIPTDVAYDFTTFDLEREQWIHPS